MVRRHHQSIQQSRNAYFRKSVLCSEPAFSNKMKVCADNDCCGTGASSADICDGCLSSSFSGRAGDVDGMASPCYFHENVCEKSECTEKPLAQKVPDSEDTVCHEMQGGNGKYYSKMCCKQNDRDIRDCPERKAYAAWYICKV